MASSSDVVVRLRAIGQAAFKSAMDEAARSVSGVGKAADKTADQTDKATRAGKQSGRTWRSAAKGVAKWAGGAAAIYGAQRAIRSSIDATMELSKSTMAIERSTGLDTKQASQWAEVTKVRGINTKQFQVGLVKLSKTMEAARGGNKKAAASLRDVGISQEQIMAGDVGGALTSTADAFEGMTSPAQKAATAQALFGKSGQGLLPLLSGGTKGLQEQMDMVDRYGATISNTKDAKAMIQHQREMQYAMDGLKVSVGTALLPVMTSFADVLGDIVGAVQPFLRNSVALKATIAAVTAAFVAYKIAVILATLATAGLSALWLWIPLAIAAIVAAVVVLYTKWGWFHRAVDNTFNWIKSHWPLLVAILTGPFGLAILAIVRNFDKIKNAARGAFNFVKSTFSKIGSIFSGGGKFVADLARGIADWLNAHTPFGDKISAGPIHFRLPALALGGTMPWSGTALVGERGPELVNLPGGARVTPLAMSAPALGGVMTTANFYLDRRLVGTAVARDTSDRKARR